METTKKNIDKYVKEYVALLKKHKLASRVVLTFPKRKKINLIIKLAMWILDKQGAVLDTEFVSTKK